MEEKKLSGWYRPMKMPIKNAVIRYFFISSIIAMLIAFSSVSSAFDLPPGPFNEKPPSSVADIPPGTTVEGTTSPVLAAISVTQFGSDALQVQFRGREIPVPRQASAPGDAKLVIQFDNVRFPQTTDKNDWWSEYGWDTLKFNSQLKETWWKQYDLPLLNRINAEHHDENSVRLTFTSSKPLVLDSVDTLPGSDAMMIILKVYREPEPVPEPVKQAPLAKGDPMGITTPVSLQLKDIEAKAVFRMLANIKKINLLLDPSVPDIVIPSVIFNGIPFNEAFAYILRMTELSYSMVGNTLVVGKAESIGRVTGKEVTRAYSLSYAVDDAGDLRGDLTSALTGLIPLSKPPTLDGRNRTLYVTATEQQHIEVAALLAKLDHPGRQIMLQARVVEVNDGAQQDLEALVSAVYDQWLFNFTRAGVRAGYNYVNNSATFLGEDYNLPYGPGPTDEPVYVPSVTMDAGLKMLTAGLNALETSNKARNLAHPSVITLDGKEARVNLQSEVLYPNGVDANGNVSYAKIEAGPMLSFTPIIGRNGMTTIKVVVETGSINWSDQGFSQRVPLKSVRRVETVVRIRNGEPFVVGGLYQDIKTRNRSRIPVLGYIPLLGDLFTVRSDTHTKTEVAMIVIPYILDVPEGGIPTSDLQGTSLSQ
jgi:type IV pilus assembly protein PilQ